MNFDAIASLIGSVGFPIFMSVYLIYFMQTELKEMRKTIENNTLTMQKVIDSLEDFNKKREWQWSRPPKILSIILLSAFWVFF